MQSFVDHLMSPATAYLTVMVIIGTFFARRIIETALPDLKKLADANDPEPTYKTTFSRWWNEVILYALAPGLGALSGLMEITLIHGDGDASIGPMSSRVVYGVVIGWFSSFLYKLLKKLAKKTTGVDLPSASSPPPPAAKP